MSTRIGWKSVVTDSFTTDVENACSTSGQRHLRWIGDKAYRFVKNATGGALALGDVVYFGTNDPTFSEVYSLGQSTKGTLANLLGGVVVATGGIASASYGWVQVYGYSTAVNTLGVAGVNEVQTIVLASAAGGAYTLGFTTSAGVKKRTAAIAYNASTATQQTAIDNAVGASLIIAGGTDASNFTLTYSGAGYAALPQELPTVDIHTAITSLAGITSTRTTPGIAASVVGDVLAGVSGQLYATKSSIVGVAPLYVRRIIAMETYATATPATKKGFIFGL